MNKYLLLFLSVIFALNLSAQSISYKYDNLGRLTEAIYPDSTTLSYTYDASGNRITAQVENGCQVRSKPAITIKGNLTLCSGDSVVLSSLSSSQNLWSTGASTQSIIVKQAGKYYVTSTYSSTCSKISDTITVIVKELPVAKITPSGNTTFCSGDSVILKAEGGSDYTFLWSTGATSQNINASAAGNYTVKVTNGTGCSTTSTVTAVIVNSLPEATITADGPTTFTYGNSVTLTASAAISYLWSNGATTQSIKVASTGNYKVTLKNASGCYFTSSEIAVTVTKASQTITFAALPLKNHNDADFDPGATASSGLLLSYKSSDPSVATIVNNKVHIVAEGTATITASQSGNTNYNAAADVSQSVKIIFTLPVSNFKISATGETCKTSNNGLITITAVQPLNYTVAITGNNLTVPPYNFTGSLEIKDLSAGTYTVCITVAGQRFYKQCYDINITEPKDLALYSTIDKSVNKISLNLEGGSLYNIELNGIRYQTTQNIITLPLLKGDNHLKVATDKVCQGIIEKLISYTEDILIYPNPFENILNLDIGNENSGKAKIEVRTVDGKLVYSKQDFIEYGRISLDLSSLNYGFYLLKVSLDHSESIHKIFKK